MSYRAFLGAVMDPLVPLFLIVLTIGLAFSFGFVLPLAFIIIALGLS